jgi:hypothetical protein
MVIGDCVLVVGCIFGCGTVVEQGTLLRNLAALVVTVETLM